MSHLFDIYQTPEGGKSGDAESITLPSFQKNAGIDDPAKYIASEDLRYAVNVVLTLGQLRHTCQNGR